MEISNFLRKSNNFMSTFMADSFSHSTHTVIISLTVFASISCFFLSFSYKNQEMIVSQYNPVFFASDSEKKNFLNIALTNLSPQNLFVEISCYFVNNKFFRALTPKTKGEELRNNKNVSIRTIPFKVSSMYMYDNVIESRKTSSFNSGVYFKNNTKNSTKFVLSTFSPIDFDGYRAQLSSGCTSTKDCPLNNVIGLQSSFRFINSSEIHFFSQLFSFFLGCLALFSGIYLLFKIKKRAPNYNEVLNILLCSTGFITFAPMIMPNMKYSNYEYILFSFFNMLSKLCITNHIISLKAINVQRNTELYIALFFIIFFFSDLCQFFNKQIQISLSKTLNVPSTLYDYIYYLFIIIYIGIEIDLTVNTSFKDKHVLVLLAIINYELITISGLNLISMVFIGISFSCNSRLMATMTNVFFTTLITVAMYPARVVPKDGNDEEPLVSAGSDY